MNKIIGAIFLLALTFGGCQKQCESNPINTTTNGCGDFIVYQKVTITGFDNSLVRINVERDKLNLGSGFKAFDMVSSPEIISVIETINRDYIMYCNDALPPDLKITETWEVQSGTVEIRIVRDKNECEYGYVVDVVLKNAIYKNSLGNEFTIGNLYLDNVIVGWYAG